MRRRLTAYRQPIESGCYIYIYRMCTFPDSFNDKISLSFLLSANHIGIIYTVKYRHNLLNTRPRKLG